VTALTCSRVRDLAPGFVLGALDRSEMAAVREHLDSCPKPHPEVRQLGGVVPYLGESIVPIEPAEGLKTAVLAAVQADMDARGAAPQPAAPRAPQLTVVASDSRGEPGGPAALAMLRGRRVATWLTRAAAAIVILGLLGTVVTLRGALDRAQENDIWGYIGTAGSRSTVLAPAAEGDGAGAAALLPNGSLRVHVSGLKPTHDDEVYVVWISVDGGSSRSAGWFTVDDSGVGDVAMKGISASASIQIYVCREASKNVTQPTGPVVLSGKILMWAEPASTPTF
jgi:hypothetical protein